MVMRGSVKDVYQFVAGQAATGPADLSYQTIALETGYSLQCVSMALARLERAGLIGVQRRRGRRPNGYQVREGAARV
jgi:DNA-binding transcriptional regulator GbsR (MarR family)